MDENPTLDSVSSKVWIDFISGWGSGAASILLCQPIDTILTRYQATKVSSFANTKNFVFYSSKDLVSQYGVKSLWRGTSAMIGAVPLQNALLMSGYGFGSKWASKYNKSFEPSTHDSKGWSQEQIEYSGIFFGGCLGGFIQSFLMSPVELIKVKQQVVGKSVYDATMAVTSGISSYSIGWRGIEATILRDGIPHGVWFVSYEYCKRSMIIFKDEFCDGGDNAPINWNEVPVGADVSILSGAFAATVAWLVGYPADVIKTRIQSSQQNVGVIETARSIVQESGGPLGLYRGFGLKLVRAIPASAVCFATYECIKNILVGM